MKPFKKLSGFSLIELILVIIITAIIAGMSMRYLMQGLMSYSTSKQFGYSDWQANLALERMTREIRSIITSSQIITASANNLSFMDGTNTPIAYQITSGNLTENSNILANNATGLSFTYYDKTGTATATIESIQYVQMGLAISSNGYTDSYSTTVNLPNLQ